MIAVAQALVEIAVVSSTINFQVQGDRAIMRGELGSGSDAAIRALMQNSPQVKTLVMQDVPGSNDDEAAIRAYNLVRQFGLNTEVPANGEIASGGVDFFIAGVQRRVLAGGFVGVHAWSDGTQSATAFPPSSSVHRSYIDFYRRMGLPDPEGFYFFTINAAPASGIHGMSRAEISRYGLEN